METLEKNDIEKLILKYFDAKFVSQDKNALKYKIVGINESDLSKSFINLYKESFKLNYAVSLRKENNMLFIYVFKKVNRTNKFVVIILAIVTLISVYISGLVFNNQGKSLVYNPFAYLVALIVPLLLHETGHWLTMRRFKVPASPPYLLPAPPLQLGFLGTFGAVINMEWLPPTNNILALTGVMGPLTGFLSAIPFTVIGLKYSTLVPQSLVPPGSTINLVPLIVSIITYIEKIPTEYVIQPSAMMFASYIVFFVTFLNLIPVAQLDGGHVLRAALGERNHRIISIIFIFALIFAGLWYDTFAVFGLFAFFFFILSGGRHPGSAMGDDKLSKSGMIAVIIYSILLILTLPLPA